MTLKEYLSDLLGGKGRRELMRHLKAGETIIVSGVPCSGKTTLVDILRSHGYKAVDNWNRYEVVLDKPLEVMQEDIRDNVQ